MRGRLVGLVVAIALTAAAGVVMQAPGASAVCRNLPPDYPGCTVAQAAYREAPTKKLTHHRYKKNRWNQSHNEWANLGPRANKALKREYRQAVVRFQRSHKAETGKAARLAFKRWRAFKRVSGDACTGQFGGIPAAWCWFGKKVNEPIREATNKTIRTTLTCAGVVAITRWGDGVDDRLIAVTKTAARLGPWRSGPTVACVVSVLYTEGIKNLFSFAKSPSAWDQGR